MAAKKVILLFIIVSVFATVLAYFGGQNKQISPAELKPQVNEANGVVFEVAPANFDLGKPIEFEIKIDTHSGSLDFDLAKISSLEDDAGNKYTPTEWRVPAHGGHHLSGTLLFPKINNGAAKIKLTIQDVSLRIFEWYLK